MMITRLLNKNSFCANVYLEVRNLFNLSCIANEFRKYNTIVLNDRKAGFFSIFFQTLAAINVCKWNKQNLKLNYTKGPYYDPQENTSSWWENYYSQFEFDFSTTRGHDSKIRYVEDYEMMRRLAYAGTEMNKLRANKLMQLCVLKYDIQEEINQYECLNFKGKKTIGIHYRGTDKVSGGNPELERVPYEYVFQLMSKYESNADNFFIATDEEDFLNECSSRFSNKTLFTQSIRSKNNLCVHLGNSTDSPCRLGRQALIDSILLSKCNYLLRCDSNLSLASLFFNCNLKSINMTEKYLKSI